MTQAEYATHRGCSHVAVHKAVKAGRITLIEGKIDPAVADIQWAQNTRARVPRGAAQDSGTLPLDAGGVQSHEPPAPELQDPQYSASRARREQVEAERAWLRLQEEQGALVRIDQVRSELAARLAPVREALLQLPARIAPELARHSDPGRISVVLESEIHQILASLSKGRLAAADETSPIR